jgi:hypothetical protein
MRPLLLVDVCNLLMCRGYQGCVGICELHQMMLLASRVQIDGGAAAVTTPACARSQRQLQQSAQPHQRQW